MALASAMKKSSVRARWRGSRTVMLVGSWIKPLSIVVKSCHSGRRSVRSQPLLTHTTIKTWGHYTLNGFIITYIWTIRPISFARLMFPLRWAGGYLHGLFLNLTPQVHVYNSLIHTLSADDDVTVSKRHGNHANHLDMWSCCHGNNQGSKPRSDALCKRCVNLNARQYKTHKWMSRSRSASEEKLIQVL